MKNESGRSMVEMLGTLAVMGVLTLIGVKGFQSAIARYQANEVLNVARVILQEQTAAKVMGGTLTKSSVWMGKLPGTCWICSYKGDDEKLVIGGCDEKVMKAFGSILGKRWKATSDYKRGHMTIKDEADVPPPRNKCENNSENLVYDNN